MEKNFNTLAIPMAIVIAGLIIAGAIFFNGRSTEGTPANANTGQTGEFNLKERLPLISEKDHVLGNPEAPIVFIEYSDLECPACQYFHAEMHKLLDEYGTTGEVAWVYRHAPLEQLHPKAPKEAQAAECAAELGGNDAFWKFIDRVFEISPANNKLDLALLPDIAEFAGVDRAEFTACLESDRHQDTVAQGLQEAINTAEGGRLGTPHNFVVINGGEEIIPLPGGVPFANLKDIVEQIKSQL